ncbi:MAG TPA: DNA double-strand break repair nuclease NurA [Actinomycetota bacterium]|nr:DNA double-strand break repair nuclease NurA [Actinomycetota bacterium]
MRIAVEAWSHEYAAEVDLGGPDDFSVEDVRTDHETRGEPWEPVPRSPDAPGVETVAFVDGTRRVDARLFGMNGGDMPVPGLAGSIGVGAVVCEPSPDGCAARITTETITRWLVLGGGHAQGLYAGPALSYEPMPHPADTTDVLFQALQEHMRRLEANLAVAAADQGHLVFADGPLAKMDPGKRKVIGLIKSHSVRYLKSPEEDVLARLGCGERTPLFSFGEKRPRYSWYVRLCERDAGGHAWQGLVRCEVPAALSVEAAIELANASTALLPRYASKPYWDKRAPQNLVPIAALEKRLRHLLGEPALVYRQIRSAAARAEVPA